MAFVKVPEELLDADITAAQFRILANLIKYSFDDGHSYIGYAKLAAACYTSKGFIIKSIKELEQKGFLRISHRGDFSRSNDITLTLENGLKKCRTSEGNSSGTALKGSLNETPKGSLNETPKGSLNETPKGSLNETHGSLNETPHKDIRFKYQDLNLNTREEGSLLNTPRVHSNNIAPDDLTSGRSMPSQQAGEGSAKRVSAEPLAAKDERMRKLLTRIYPDFTTWYALFRTPAGTYQINPVSSLIERIMPDKARINSVPDGVEVCSWAETPRLGLIKIM